MGMSIDEALGEASQKFVGQGGVVGVGVQDGHLLFLVSQEWETKTLTSVFEWGKANGVKPFFQLANPRPAAGIAQYEHHGALVSVQNLLKGRHREHCLCYQGCVHFKPGQPGNCEIAQALYDNCVRFNIVTPVWECPKFQQ